MGKQVRVYQEVEIVQRGDGYMDATAMCRACGKEWGHYWANDSTRTYVEALAENIGIPTFRLAVVRRGRNGGTWVHPQVAIHLSQWLSPQFAVQVSRWVLERLEEERDPELAISRGRERAVARWRELGRSEDWIAERLQTIDIRHLYTDVLKAHGVKAWGFGACTNAIYERVLGGKCDEVKALKQLGPRDSLRDHLGRRELSFVRFAEELASMRLEQDRAQGNQQCLDTSRLAGDITRDAIRRATAR